MREYVPKKILGQGTILFIHGGLLGVSSDGKMELDLTFDTIFQSERENIESILAEKIKGD